MTRFQPAHRHLLLLFLMMILIGCGGGDGAELGTVSGTVNLDGSPLPNATIEFHPIDGGRMSSAETDENGQYMLLHAPGRDGALIGKHKVKITTGLESDGNVTKEQVPIKYNTNTTLDKEVVAGDNTIDFELDSEGAIQQPGSTKPSRQGPVTCM